MVWRWSRASRCRTLSSSVQQPEEPAARNPLQTYDDPYDADDDDEDDAADDAYDGDVLVMLQQDYSVEWRSSALFGIPALASPATTPVKFTLMSRS